MTSGRYATTDFYLAVSLHAAGQQLHDIVPDAKPGTHGKRYRFVFVDCPERADRVAAFQERADVYPVKVIATSIRELKSRLYTAMDGDGGGVDA